MYTHLLLSPNIELNLEFSPRLQLPRKRRGKVFFFVVMSNCLNSLNTICKIVDCVILYLFITYLGHIMFVILYQG